MTIVTGNALPRAPTPAVASTSTIASGPYATEDSASSESAESPCSTVSRWRSSDSGSSPVDRADPAGGASSAMPPL